MEPTLQSYVTILNVNKGATLLPHASQIISASRTRKKHVKMQMLTPSYGLGLRLSFHHQLSWRSRSLSFQDWESTPLAGFVHSGPCCQAWPLCTGQAGVWEALVFEVGACGFFSRCRSHLRVIFLRLQSHLGARTLSLKCFQSPNTKCLKLALCSVFGFFFN